MVVKEEEWRENTLFREGVQILRPGGFFLSPSSAEDIHWNSSFLQNHQQTPEGKDVR